MNLSDPVALQWGVLIAAPSGKTIFEARDSYHGAVNDVTHINTARPNSASLVYREVTYAEWSTSPLGDEFGVRYTWDDGHQEIHKQRSRLDAESQVRLAERRPDPKACVVSRTIEYGQWWAAQAEAAH